MKAYKVMWLTIDKLEVVPRYVEAYSYPTMDRAVIAADTLLEKNPEIFCVTVDELDGDSIKPVYHKVIASRCG